MSFFARNYVPMGLAVVFGIANGYYAFQPLLKEKHQGLDLTTEKGLQTGPVSNDAEPK
ncbi:hypothetical protein F4802DRAFT_84693 [Xylaria palmicola]|nr:hypothetical protein F4802DRAFT_84693 [Xylaria palmicola]